jgi:hypothetical protein
MVMFMLVAYNYVVFRDMHLFGIHPPGEVVDNP